MNKFFKSALCAALALFIVQTGFACTNVLVTKGASKDGSILITYSADSHQLYGELYFTPAGFFKPGTWMNINEWDSGKYLGQIPQLAGQTYQTVGNMNEHQLAIAESTWSSRPELLDTTAIVDYGSLIYLTLQRARTAREAIEVMTGLVERYGYRSTGESFSIADPNEIWVLEMVSKGMKEKGAVWVAIRIPDDCISGHANQSRIHQIPFSDKENCMYSEDVVSFAREMGYFEGDDSEFSFSNAYAESDYLSYRGCDGRVWAYFNRFASGMSRYLPFVMEMKGETLPLYVKPERKISVRDMQAMMRDHYENTPLAMTADEGAGPWESPYRYSPLMWKVDSTEYFHERPIATQQTGFSFVAQMRDWLPDAVGGILWFGVDDAAISVYNPIYCGVKRVPECFRVGNGDMCTFSWTSAFWVNNWVANQTYVRFSQIYPDVQKVQQEIEDSYETSTKALEKEATALCRQNPEAVADLLTAFSDSVSESATARYKKLGEYLLVKYMDGRIKQEENGKFKRTAEGYPESPLSPGYSESYYRRIVESEGDRLRTRPMPAGE